MGDDRYATSWRQGAPRPSSLTGKWRSWGRSAILCAKSAAARPNSQPFLRGLYCHYVFDDQKRDFERLIVELKTLGQFIDTNTCLDIAEGKRELDGQYFHLSFDDGFRNLLTNAAPILRKENVPAAIFVCTNLVGADWNATRDFCLNRGNYGGVIEMLRWDDLGCLLEDGFEIGSHTRSHARLSEISRDRNRLEDEIAGSKQVLEERLGRPCRYISWPFGRISDFDARSQEMVQAAGYRACFGAFRGSIHPRRTDPFAIPRHQFEPQWPPAHVKYFAGGNMEASPIKSSTTR